MAKVYGAMALCRAKLPFRARASVTRMNGTTTAARYRVRDQDGEIERPRQSSTLEMRDAGAQHQVVVKVRDEEQRGGDERRKHHSFVGLYGGRA